MTDRRRRWLLILAAVLAFALTAALGQWQLRRAAQKAALQQQMEERGRLPALDSRALLSVKNLSEVWSRRAELRGQWLAPFTVMLDNRPMNGKVGFIVVTPLLLEGSDRAILVQRGWVQRNFEDRARIAPVATPVGPVTVSGRIEPPPSKLLELKHGPDATGPSLIRQNIEPAEYAAEMGRPLLLQASLQQTGTDSAGLVRDWPAPSFGIERHYGYAAQWFALSALIVFLFLWFQWMGPYVRARRAR